MSDSEMKEAIKEFADKIMASDTYKEYLYQREKIKKQPELYDKVMNSGSVILNFRMRRTVRIYLTVWMPLRKNMRNSGRILWWMIFCGRSCLSAG